jgi:hypothetical protein
VAGVGVAYINGLVTYFVMPDELGYVKQAGHIARTGLLNVPGDMFFGSYGQLEPLLIAPAYALFSTPTAFDVAHAINAVAFATTGIPVYLLGRRIYVCRAACLLAAALTVVVPWLAMSGTVLTEPTAYPAFCWALLGMQNALERRTPRADVLALAGLALAFFARTQFVILVPAFLVALVIHRAWDREGGLRAIVREHGVLLGVLIIVLVVIATDRGALLTNYSVTTSGSLFPDGWVHAARELTAYVAVALGVLPLGLGAAWTVITLIRPANRAGHAFASLSLVLGVTLIVLAGTYTVRFSPAINDRYLLYLVPILTVSAIALLLDPRRGYVAVAVGGIAAAVLVGTSDLAEAGPSLISPSATWHTVLNGRTQQVDRALGLQGLSTPAAIAVVAGIVSLVVAFAQTRLARPVVTAIVGGGLLAYGTVETGYTLHSVRATQAGASPDFVAARDWVDQIVGRDGSVTALLGPAGDDRTSAVQWWDASFFNESIRRVYAQDNVIYDQGYARAFTVDPTTGGVHGLPAQRLAITAVADQRVGWRGARELAVHGGLRLVRLPTPLTAQWTANAADPAGTTPPERPTTIWMYGDGDARTREVTVAATAAPAATTPAPFSVTSGQRTYRAVAPVGGPRTVRLRVHMPARGAVRVELRASSAPVVLAGVSLQA